MNQVHNLRIVLMANKREHILNNLVLDQLDANALASMRNTYNRAFVDSIKVAYVMLGTMDQELQKQFENMQAHDMIMGLKDMFKTQARTERFSVTKTFEE